MHYSMNTIIIFDGSQDGNITPPEPLSFRGEYPVVSPFNLRRDLVQLVTSKVDVLDTNKEIQPFDLIVFHYKERTRFGKVYEIERDGDVATLLFTYGADVHQMDVPLYANQPFDYAAFTNRQKFMLSFNTEPAAGTGEIAYEQPIMSVDVAARQLLRRRHMPELYVIQYDTGTKLWKDLWVHIDESLTYGLYPPLKIRLDDPQILGSYVLKIGQDKMTRLRLYNSDNTAQYADYQLLNDGSIVVDTTAPDPFWPPEQWFLEFDYTPTHPNSVRPQRYKMQTANADQWNSLAFATDVFKQNEYDNEIEIELLEDNGLFALDNGTPQSQSYGSLLSVIDILLGRPVQVYLPGSGLYIDTIVSGYDIKEGRMKIVFGLTRTRLTDVINNYINGDNR